MSKLKDDRQDKKTEKTKKKLERGQVISMAQYRPQVPAYKIIGGVKRVTHEEIAGRCLTTADMLARQTQGEFLRLYAESDAIPLCYMLFAYHQNCMVIDDITEADVIVEVYEKDEVSHILGTKENVQFVALFKDDEGIMPWALN